MLALLVVSCFFCYFVGKYSNVMKQTCGRWRHLIQPVRYTLLYIYLCMAVLLSPLPAMGQQTQYGKLSGQLRQWVRHEAQRLPKQKSMGRHVQPQVCAFVQTRSATDADALPQHGCTVLRQYGDISIVQMPLSSVPALSADARVCRIEAQHGTRPLLDSVYIQVGAREVYAAQQLPQAFTGRGVVVGVQDVGFDLTHPTFLDRNTSSWRIQRFWDMLSTDTIDSPLFVGAAYEGEALKTYAHSRDAHLISHGTHTAGIAAGTGFGTAYRGVAYDSQLCLVSNAVSDDAELIDSTQRYKYTYATDALGFQYIFDYAEACGLPCVINFSEGSTQDFHGDDILYNEVINRMTGPGHILVAAVGNDGWQRNYFRKPRGEQAMGAFIRKWGKRVAFTLQADTSFDLRLKVWNHQQPETYVLPMSEVLLAPDSTFTDTLALCSDNYVLTVQAYPSCYDPTQTCYDVALSADIRVGMVKAVSVEVMGKEADVAFYRLVGELYDNALDPTLSAGDASHSILSPSCAASVIAVGATAYRTQYVNSVGDVQVYNAGTHGQRAHYSAIGPTYDGRIKPDVMAPGTNIISSYSSYYISEQASPESSLVSTFAYNGRTYAWQSDAGTSMAAPVVAGVIALWLQARPDLSPADVMDVLRATCRRPDPSLTYPNNLYGYGEIDAYRGLLYLLGIDGIADLSHQQPTRATFSIDAQGCVTVHLTAPASCPFSIQVYNTAGQRLATHQFAAGQCQYTFSLAHLPHGIYALQLNGGNDGFTGSTLVRR